MNKKSFYLLALVSFLSQEYYGLDLNQRCSEEEICSIRKALRKVQNEISRLIREKGDKEQLGRKINEKECLEGRLANLGYFSFTPHNSSEESPLTIVFE